MVEMCSDWKKKTERGQISTGETGRLEEDAGRWRSQEAYRDWTMKEEDLGGLERHGENETDLSNLEKTEKAWGV